MDMTVDISCRIALRSDLKIRKPQRIPDGFAEVHRFVYGVPKEDSKE